MLCELGLPIRAPRGHWNRDIGAGSIRMEAASAEQALPGGRMLRLSLIHICDAARRTGSTSLNLGEDVAAVARHMGAEGKAEELVEQMHRMLAAKISVSWGGSPEFTIFDARSRSRGEHPEWRPNIRLGAKFLASLQSHAVALDRRIVQALSDSPLALDAYAWTRLALGDEAAGATRTVSWNDLLSRFGSASQNVTSFRGLFEPALRLVFDADPSIEIAVDEEGVSIRRARPEETGAADIAPEPQAVAPAAPVPAAPVPEAPKPVPPPEPPPVVAPAPSPATAAPPQDRPGDTGAPPSADRITEDRICLPREITGLSQCMWLRRGHGSDQVLVGVTPGMRFDPDRLTILAVEPMILQISGGLYQAEFDRVSAWIMANRDLIDDFWDDRITTFQEIRSRLRKVPAPGWR